MNEYKITQETIIAFGKYLVEDEKSEATQKKYLHDVKCFLLFLQGEPVDKPTVLAYKTQLEKRYCLTSANSMLASLNSFFRFMGWKELCVRQFRIQRSAFCPEKKELTKQEYIRLVQTAEKIGAERLSLLLQTICATGIRVSELPFITVEAVGRGEALVLCKGKKRRIFIAPSLQKKLMRYIKKKKIAAGSVFITRGGKPMDRSNIWREMKLLCQQANVDSHKVFPHNLRHLFARTFYAVDKDLVRLADVLGHSNVNTTRIYMISSGQEHRKQVERMNLIL